MSDDEQRLRAALERIRDLSSNSYLNHALAINAIAAEALAEPEPVADTRPELTIRQAEMLCFIELQTLTNGYPPTVREIGRRFDIKSPNGVCGHLKALQKKGYLQWDPDKSRTLAVVVSARGRSAAGEGRGS
jgi:repressor LexA